MHYSSQSIIAPLSNDNVPPPPPAKISVINAAQPSLGLVVPLNKPRHGVRARVCSEDVSTDLQYS